MQDLSLFFQADATDDDLFPFSSLMATQEATSQEDLFDPEKDYEIPADEGQNAFRRRAFSRKQSTTTDAPAKKAIPKKDAQEDGNAVKKGSKVAKKASKNTNDDKTPKKQSTNLTTPAKKATPKKDAKEDGNAMKKASKVAKKAPKNTNDNKTPKKVKVKKDDDKMKNGKTKNDEAKAAKKLKAKMNDGKDTKKVENVVESEAQDEDEINKDGDEDMMKTLTKNKSLDSTNLQSNGPHNTRSKTRSTGH